MQQLIEAFDEALVRRIRLALAQAGVEWLLEEHEIQLLLRQVDGDLGQFALELNDRADMLALCWLPLQMDRRADDHASCQARIRATKQAAIAIDRYR